MATTRRSLLLMVCPKTYSLRRQLVLDYKKSRAHERLFSAIASQGQKKIDGVDSPASKIADLMMGRGGRETPTITTDCYAIYYDDLCRRSIANVIAVDNTISLLTEEHYRIASIHHKGGNADGSTFKLSSIIRLSLFAEHNELRMIRRNHISAPWETIPV